MKTLEIGLIGSSIVGVILRILDLPGNSFLLILSLGLQSVVYFLFGIVLFNNKTIKDAVSDMPFSPVRGYTFKNFGVGTVLSVASLGILFKSLSFPGSSIMLLFGIIGTGIYALITYRKKEDNAPFVLKRLIGFGGYCLLLFIFM
mgnify:CR=1 FL=1